MKRFKLSQDSYPFKAGTVIQVADGLADKMEKDGKGCIVSNRTAAVKGDPEMFANCRPITSEGAAKRKAKAAKVETEQPEEQQQPEEQPGDII